MTDDRCNGWTNRETWSLMLWINNDEGLQDMAREAVADAASLWHAETALRDWVESLFTRAGYVDTFGDTWPDTLADIACEIGSLDRIDYREAALALRQDIDEAAQYA